MNGHTPETAQAELERLQAKGLAGGSTEISATVPNQGDREAYVEAYGQRVDEVERELRRGRSAINTGAVYMARYLCEYIDDRLWEGQHDSLAEGLAQPGIEISEKHAKNLALVYRSLVIERQWSPEDLKGLDLRKLQCALPAIRTGEVGRDQALADARKLTFKDMKSEYKRGRNKQLDAADEPPRVQCGECGRWYAPEGGEADP